MDLFLCACLSDERVCVLSLLTYMEYMWQMDDMENLKMWDVSQSLIWRNEEGGQHWWEVRSGGIRPPQKGQMTE